MYGVNGSVPKTLVRHLVHYYADTCKDEELRAVLYDVLDTHRSDLRSVRQTRTLELLGEESP